MIYKKIIAGNWKMKLDYKASLSLAKKLAVGYKKVSRDFSADLQILVCPDNLVLAETVKILKRTPIAVGAQNIFWEQSGAYTGEISPSNIQKIGCTYTLVGHSERRQYLKEDGVMLNKKLAAAWNTPGLTPILCIGESWAERRAGRALKVLEKQLKEAFFGPWTTNNILIIVAYEPVWAIGSGRVITPEDAAIAHAFIAKWLAKRFPSAKSRCRVLYGGSVDDKNAVELAKVPHIDGVLVGGASLDARKFFNIAKAFSKKVSKK